MSSSSNSLNNPFVTNTTSSESDSYDPSRYLDHNLPLSAPVNINNLVNYNRLRMSTRDIAEGSEVRVEHFPECLVENLSVIQWSAFLTLKGPIHTTIVREFYSNFEFTPSRELKFRLFHKEYTMTLQEFGNIMRVPCEGVEFFNPNLSLNFLPEFVTKGDIVRTFCQKPINHVLIQNLGIQANQLAPKYDFWFKVISKNIFCKSADLFAQVYASEAALLWCIKNYIPVNVAYFMAKRMHGLLRDDTIPLPYGAHLTNLFKYLGIQALHVDPLTSTQINYDSVRPFNEGEEGEHTPAWSATGSEDSIEEDQFVSLLSPVQRAVLHRQNRRTHKLLKKFLRKFACGGSSSHSFKKL